MSETYYEPWDSRYNKKVPPGSMLEAAYQFHKTGEWSLPNIVDARQNPPVALNKQDEEVLKSALILLAKGTISKSEYDNVIRSVFAQRTGTENITDTSGTSSGVPHGPDETSTAVSAKTPPAKVGWTNQNQPEGKYRTTDPQVNPNPRSMPPHQTGQGVTPGGRGYSQYPQPTYVTTGTEGKGGTEAQGGTFGAGYRDQTPSGYSATGYDSALGEQQQIKKGSVIEAAYLDSRALNKMPNPKELAKAGPTAGMSSSPMSYRDSDTAAAGGSAKMEDLAEATRLEEIGNRLLQEDADEMAGTDVRTRPKGESRKHEMARKAFEQASALTQKWQSGIIPSGLDGNEALQKGTWGKKRHGAGF